MFFNADPSFSAASKPRHDIGTFCAAAEAAPFQS
jgi:hypothetical protein